MNALYFGWPQLAYLTWFVGINAWWLMVLTRHKAWRGCAMRIATLGLITGLLTCGGFFTHGVYAPTLAPAAVLFVCDAFALWVVVLAWGFRVAENAQTFTSMAVEVAITDVIAKSEKQS